MTDRICSEKGDFRATLRAFPVEGPDRAWIKGATWRTRDGQRRWTGRAVRVEDRAQRLRAFLASNPPSKAAARATALLAPT